MASCSRKTIFVQGIRKVVYTFNSNNESVLFGFEIIDDRHKFFRLKDIFRPLFDGHLTILIIEFDFWHDVSY